MSAGTDRSPDDEYPRYIFVRASLFFFPLSFSSREPGENLVFYELASIKLSGR